MSKKFTVVKLTDGQDRSVYRIKVHKFFGLFSYWMRETGVCRSGEDFGRYLQSDIKEFGNYKHALGFAKSELERTNWIEKSKKINKKVICEISSNGDVKCKSTLETFENE